MSLNYTPYRIKRRGCDYRADALPELVPAVANCYYLVTMREGEDCQYVYAGTDRDAARLQLFGHLEALCADGCEILGRRSGAAWTVFPDGQPAYGLRLQAMEAKEL